jgi:3-oxoacyl-[acyl-carrier protein] reductase
MSLNLENRVALVTGASGGIGSAIAVSLAEVGAVVCVHYNTNRAKADEVVKLITDSGGQAYHVCADLTVESDLEKLVNTVIEKSGKIDILINNAAVNREGLIIRQKQSDMDYVFGTNILALINVSRLVVKHMLKNKYGRLVHISSPAATAGSPAQTLYSASKAAIHGFSKALAVDLGSRNITSNVVIPGIINTRMVENITDERRAFFLSRIPMGRFGEPKEVASAVRFLVSDEADYISGAELTVTGGGAVL